jgi:hypothetical protein
MTITGTSAPYTLTVTPPTATDLWKDTPRNYKVKVILTSFPSITLKLDVSLTVNYADCSCANAVWEAPSVANQTVLVGGTATSITLPSAVIASTTSSTSSTDPGIRSCYRGSSTLFCENSVTKSFTTLTENTNKSITFITFSAGTNGNIISVLPTTSTQRENYDLRLTQTNSFGTPSLTF